VPEPRRLDSPLQAARSPRVSERDRHVPVRGVGRGVGRDRILPRLVGSMIESSRLPAGGEGGRRPGGDARVPKTAFNHLVFWFLFAQGGIIAAILIPVHVLIQGILGPLNIVTVVDRHYDTWVSALGNPIVKLYLLVLIAAPFFHFAHRIRYLIVASDLNIKLTHALDTHLHNDFVSGRRELQAETGADIGELEAGSELTLGDTTLRAIATPGHTPDHKAYLLGEGGRARALFSGGAVMLGAIARTDLFGPHLAVHLALEALTTLQVRLRALPDEIRVFPTHGGGSFCGVGGRSGHETTLGHERKTNPFFQTTEVMPFLARALTQSRYPTYYRDMSAINRGGAPLIGRTLPPLTPLEADEVAQMMDSGAAVIDIRTGRDYDAGHIPGSYQVGIDGPVSAWVGWLVARGRPLVLAGGTHEQQI